MALDAVCPNSLLPYLAHDENLLRLLAVPITGQMIHFVAQKLTAAVGSPGCQHLPTPPVTPIRGKFVPDSVTCAPEFEFPPLETFLTHLVFHSNVHTASVLGSMIYLKRITKDLQSGTMNHGPETPYRLAVALFVIASKYNHDASPPTIHWAIHVANALGIDATANWKALVDYEGRRMARGKRSKARANNDGNCLDMLAPSTGSTSLGYMFGATAITALERDLLHLLDYDLWFSEEDEIVSTLSARIPAPSGL
ncbi:PHO85 cyclin-1 [Ceratobasidium sp. AG-Ba]|nr:PHO85 cyclin-1 [Ceratobasidium sp. AG-Ba]